MPSKKSGGRRATEKKHAERDARRRRTKFKFDESKWLARYKALGQAPKDPEKRFEWVAALGAIALEEAAADPGPSPEQRREQIIRGLPQLAKVLPIAELAADLRLFKQKLDELTKPKMNGAPVDPRATGADQAPASRA